MSEQEISLKDRVCLVTGANRGIGFEVCRQLAQQQARVVLSSRNEVNGKAARQKLCSEGLGVDFVRLDVTSDPNALAAKKYIQKTYGRLDVLVNNAGILPDNRIPGKFEDLSILETSLDSIRAAFEVNTLGAIRMIQTFVPLMIQNQFGRIVNVSSLVAQLSSMDSGLPAYRISKVSLNAVTRILADELKDQGILCNSVSPGWIKTDMGGIGANESVEIGAQRIIRLVALPDSGPTGLFFREDKAIEW